MSTEDDFADLDEDEEQRAEEETTSRENYFQHCLGMLRIIILQKKTTSQGNYFQHCLGMPRTIIVQRKYDQSGELLSALSWHAVDNNIA